MAFAAEPIPQVDVLPTANRPFQCGLPRMDGQRPPSPGSTIDGELGASPRDIDSISIDSMESLPDPMGRRMLTFDNERTTTAYEAWELVSLEDRITCRSWRSFCGINFGMRWVNQNDGCVLTNAVVSFDQGELADMHEDAIRGYKHKRGASQEKAYEQDLANRAYNLPDEIYDKIQLLIGDKTIVTNRNPHRKREWHVVVLRPGEFRMTELLPERKRKNIFSRKRQPPAVRTWFVVLRGQEVKSTKEDGGWRAHHRFSNPWWRFDKQETKEGRDQHKKMAKQMDRARADRQHHPRHPGPRPAAPMVPCPRLPMSP
ncbi:hypothetical protein F4823DRAFT_255092 [Ustulina deusta]|nr:hypothetical protein F4823DRAFT_255092 [Ustulina deusta]